MEHIHKYKQVILGGKKIERGADGKKRIVRQGGTPVYKCMIPGCTHYISRDLVQGRYSICWVCDKQMVMTSQSVTMVRPRHFECMKRKEAA